MHGALTNEYTAEELQNLKFNDMSVWLHKEANYELFAQPRELFKIICALPVSSASFERNFSELKIIKTDSVLYLGMKCLMIYCQSIWKRI